MWFILLSLVHASSFTPCVEARESLAKRVEDQAKALKADFQEFMERCNENPSEDCQRESSELSKRRLFVLELANAPTPECQNDEAQALLALNQGAIERAKTKLEHGCEDPSWDLTSQCETSKEEIQCSKSLERGFKNSIYFNIEAIGDMGSFVASPFLGSAQEDEVETEKEVEADEKTSEAMVGALGLEETSYLQWGVDQGAFVAQMAGDFVAGIRTAALGAFSCEEWEGRPFESKCLKQAPNIACASCAQKVNLLCGVSSFIGTEALPSAFIMGGAMGLGLTLGTKSYQRIPEETREMLANDLRPMGNWVSTKWQNRPHPVRRLPIALRKGTRWVSSPVWIPARSLIRVSDWASMRGIEAGVLATEVGLNLVQRSWQRVKTSARCGNLSRALASLSRVVDRGRERYLNEVRAGIRGGRIFD